MGSKVAGRTIVQVEELDWRGGEVGVSMEMDEMKRVDGYWNIRNQVTCLGKFHPVLEMYGQ